MKHELTTEQIKTLATKAPELKEYLNAIVPDAFKPELVVFNSLLKIKDVSGRFVMCSSVDNRSLVVNTDSYRVHIKESGGLQYLTFERL